ncbi:MAG: hypothetical protein HND58_06555 [Planctomycetota bacterium]|nr:MAG: hypothetical protein HND58_06555 [Planctomycetota bacterium]
MNHRIPVLSCLCGIAAIASADIVPLTVYENADNADVSGLNLFVDVTDGGSYIEFAFGNSSTTSAVVTAVYVEDTNSIDGWLLNGHISAESTGVNFSDGATPANPAQMSDAFGGTWAGNLYSADADSPGPTNGINETGNESLTLRFDYGGGATFADVLAALTADDPGFRFAQHVQGLPGGYSVWTTTVPAPGSLGAIALAGLLAARRRR